MTALCTYYYCGHDWKSLPPTLPVISMSDLKDQTTVIPHTQQPLVTRTYPTVEELKEVILSSAGAQKQWAKVPLLGRIAIVNKFVVSAATRLSSLAVLNAPCRP